MFRHLTARQLTVDVLIALGCVLLRFTFLAQGAPTVLVILGMAGALAIRRLSPSLALAVAWVTALFQMATLQSPEFSNIAILAVLYATARYGGPRTKWVGLGSAAGGAVIATLYISWQGGFFNDGGTPILQIQRVVFLLAFTFFGILVTLGLSWTLGLLAKTWRTAADTRRDKAFADQAVIVEQERNRIARDMHDVVAHSLAVVIAQADGARYAAKTDPKAVDGALTTISSTAREALADVRLLLGQLRHSQDAGPQPVLADLDRLLEQMRAAGLTIDFVQAGAAAPLATAQQLAVYRIVQEALTNALRHGDTTQPVSVRLDWSAEAVDATITNASTDEPDNPVGHGIAGMRERALLVGGTLGAARHGDRFAVTAHLPVRIGASA